MGFTILLYGATGYSGRLIAEQARKMMGAEDRVILAARDGPAVEELANRLALSYRVFALDRRADVMPCLRDVDVLINAAGPFAWTAERLAKCALESGCHYVDINGELDVYLKLDDLGRHATQRRLALVCSAGHTAAASDLLLNAALGKLAAEKEGGAGIELGTIRIAMSRLNHLSRGSAETVWRSLREQVTVVRKGQVEAFDGMLREQPVLWHEPVGMLERTFDFGQRNRPLDTVKRSPRIASGANLVDTLTARLSVLQKGASVQRIESYVEAGAVARAGYQLGAFLAPLAAMPWARVLARQQINLLPVGPTNEELANDRHIVLLDIEDPWRTRVIDWRWETPNPYQFTAQIAFAIAQRIAADGAVGWLTPAQALGYPAVEELNQGRNELQGCRLDQRPTPTRIA